jgi:hypothetical protein
MQRWSQDDTEWIKPDEFALVPCLRVPPLVLAIVIIKYISRGRWQAHTPLRPRVANSRTLLSQAKGKINHIKGANIGTAHPFVVTRRMYSSNVNMNGGDIEVYSR